MNFEHLIQINNPLNPLVDSLTREQLWEGLVLRTEQPQLFVLGLDSCAILAREGDTMERELHFDELQTQEIVKAVYRESDIDTMRLIRQYAHGRKDARPLH